MSGRLLQIRVNGEPRSLPVADVAELLRELGHLREARGVAVAINGAGEVAGAILYLASFDASFITGAALAVDGGSSAG